MLGKSTRIHLGDLFEVVPIELILQHLTLKNRRVLANVNQELTSTFPRKERSKIAADLVCFFSKKWSYDLAKQCTGEATAKVSVALRRLCQRLYCKRSIYHDALRSLVLDAFRSGIDCGFCMEFHSGRGLGPTLLHFAANHQDVDVLKAILEGRNYGNAPQVLNSRRQTPLTLACVTSTKCAIVLAERFCWKERAEEWHTPLYMVCRFWNQEATELETVADMTQRDVRREALFDLVLAQQPNTVSRFCKGRAPIHAATSAAAVRKLLAANADPNMLTEPDTTYNKTATKQRRYVGGETPLHMAVSRGAADVVAALLEGGADLRLRAPVDCMEGVCPGWWQPSQQAPRTRARCDTLLELHLNLPLNGNRFRAGCQNTETALERALRELEAVHDSRRAAGLRRVADMLEAHGHRMEDSLMEDRRSEEIEPRYQATIDGSLDKKTRVAACEKEILRRLGRISIKSHDNAP